ncbi:hypothetical protein JHK85_004363 [Glycine max]|nr:hypothetical protein JHK85_004363 [Glycine max]
MYATSSARYIDEMGYAVNPVGNLITPADRCHLLSRYLPGSHIRIYNVDRGWKVQKNILAKNLRWTITDTSLSPDQRYLVYASMSPIVHIVNAGSAETESLANVTVITTNATPPAPTNSINIAIALNATKYYRAIDIKKLDFHDMCQSFLSFLSIPAILGIGVTNGITGGQNKNKLCQVHIGPACSLLSITGQKYIYTGSHHACVYIYDLVSGAQVATLKHHKSPLRDCSWHPFHTTLVSSSWDGDVVKWEFAGSGDTPASSTKKRAVLLQIAVNHRKNSDSIYLPKRHYQDAHITVVVPLWVS